MVTKRCIVASWSLKPTTMGECIYIYIYSECKYYGIQLTMRYDMIWRGFVQKLRIGPKFMALKRRNHHQPGRLWATHGALPNMEPQKKLSTFRSIWVWPMGPQKWQLFVVNKTICKVGIISGHTQVKPIISQAGGVTSKLLGTLQ